MTTYVQNIPRSFTTEHERDTCKTLDRIFITTSDLIFSNMHPSSFTDEQLRVKCDVLRQVLSHVPRHNEKCVKYQLSRSERGFNGRATILIL